jgi:hypothetical protein
MLILEKAKLSVVEQFVMPALWRLRQEEHRFETSLY